MKIPNCIRKQTLTQMANAAGARVKKLSNGQYRIEAAGNSGVLTQARYNTEDEVRSVLSKIINHNVPELDANFPFAPRGTAAAISPMRIGDQPLNMTWTREKIGAVETGVMRWYTPIKQIAQFTEAQGFGKAYSKVWSVMEAQLRKVNEVFSSVPRPKLGGRSFDQALVDLNKLTTKISREQGELAVLAPEALTRQEIRASNVFARFDDSHVEMAKYFEDLGLSEDIPRLLRTNVLIDDFLTNRKSAINEKIPALRRLIAEGQLPQDYTGTVDRVSALVGNEDSLAKVMQGMGLPENEATGLLLLRGLMGQRVDDPTLNRLIAGVNIVQQPDYVYNIPAIFRYAIAPELKPGFRNGWEQFEAERGAEALTKQLSRERWKILEDKFSESGLDAKNILGVYLPIMRQFIDVGMYPGRQYGAEAKGAINTYTRMLVEDMPEGAEVLTRRVLSGHINPYELHPSVSAHKHVRNLIMREHLDPHLKGMKEEILKIESINPDMGKVFGDYFNEGIGLPSEQFKKLTDIVRTTGRYLGVQIDDQFAERLIHTMSKLVSQATIPLRPALILRNYVSQTMFLSSFVGPEAWWEGVRIALGRDHGSQREAVMKAIKAGAINPNVLPIHGSSSIMGMDTAMFKNVPLNQLKGYADQLFDMGFSYYRKGDDFGRTAAFFGGRHRVKKFETDFIEGRLSLEDWKRKGKVKIHHEVVEAEFDRLVMEGQYDAAADFIGKELADKTNFLYNNGNHPVGWNGPVGRLLGQFGTFPTQYIQSLMEGLTRGTLKDKAEFIATHSAFNMGVVAAGLSIDVDLTSWAMLPSLGYTGGPYADVFINLATMMGGNDSEQALARRSLAFMFPSAENPRSSFIPGSYAVSDWWQAFEEDDILNGALRASGIRTLSSGDRRPRSRLMEGLNWVGDEIGR